MRAVICETVNTLAGGMMADSGSGTQEEERQRQDCVDAQ
jgi:hypothetical protein